MKLRVSLPAVLAAVLLHLLLIGLMARMALDRSDPAAIEPLSVALIAPAPLPPVRPTPSVPERAPAAEFAPKPAPKPVPKSAPRTVPKPAPKPVAKPAPAKPVPETESLPDVPATPAPPAQSSSTPSVEASTRPAASVTVPAPATATSAPAPVSAPTRTGVSIASYAATNRKPPYPRLSRAAGEEGTVILRVLVKADGTVGALEIASSSGYSLLDEAARNTVRHWRFHPATIDGKPVAEWYQVPIPFTLHEP